jgi:hypothetical protein
MVPPTKVCLRPETPNLRTTGVGGLRRISVYQVIFESAESGRQTEAA